MIRAVCVTVVGLLVAMPRAEAHLDLTEPPSRYGPDVSKQPPCGQTGGTRTDNTTTYRPGETITVKWNEYVDHPGHFRIAFDADGDDDFVDPICLAGCDTRTPTVEMNSNAAVMLDGIADRNGGDYEVEVTLPDVECEACTLQVIQVMYDKPPYTLPGNEMYYQCADLVLRVDGTEDDDGGCSCSSGTAASPAPGGLLMLLPFVRRRRPKA